MPKICKLSFVTFIIFTLLGVQGDVCAYVKDDTAIIQQIIKDPKHAFIELKAIVADKNTSKKRQAELMIWLAEISYYIDQPENIFKYTEQPLAGGLLSNSWKVRALISQARGYFQRSQHEEYFVLANKAVNSAEQHDLSKLKISALVERAYASLLLGYKIKATADLKLANKYISVLSDTFVKGMLLERFSIAIAENGNTKLAIEKQLEVIELYEDISAGPHFLSIAYYNLALNYTKTQAWQQEGSAMLKSYQWSLKDNNHLNQAFSLARLAKYEMRRGNIVLAEDYFEKAIIAADKSESGRIKIIARSALARFLCSNDKEDECEELLVNTITFAKNYQMEFEATSLTRALADLYYRQKSFDKAYQILKSTVVEIEEK